MWVENGTKPLLHSNTAAESGSVFVETRELEKSHDLLSIKTNFLLKIMLFSKLLYTYLIYFSCNKAAAFMTGKELMDQTCQVYCSHMGQFKSNQFKCYLYGTFQKQIKQHTKCFTEKYIHHNKDLESNALNYSSTLIKVN